VRGRVPADRFAEMAGSGGERRESVLADPPLWLIAALVLLRVAFAIARSAHAGALAHDPDVARFVQIAHAGGLPYREFPVEYAPVEYLLIRLVARAAATSAVIRIVALSLVCDLGTAAILARGWGRAAAARYLFFGLPLVWLLYLRLDLATVLLAVAGLSLARRRQAGGGVVLALGAAAKLWPGALAPAFLVEGRRRAFAAFVATAAIVALAWLGVGGTAGFRQVATFRGATGWGAESTVGAIVWVATGGPLRLEQGTTRVGEVPDLARAALALALAVILVAIWWRARGRTGAVEAGASLAAVASVIALSPLFSLQYAGWLLPWAAIAAGEDGGDRGEAALGFAVAVLTGVLSFLYAGGRTPPTAIVAIQVLLLVRNACCLAIPLVWLASARARSRAGAP
jgi:hypothetical protein